MHRTVDDYDSMTKREIIKAKQEKAQMYVYFTHREIVPDIVSGVSRSFVPTMQNFEISLND